MFNSNEIFLFYCERLKLVLSLGDLMLVSLLFSLLLSLLVLLATSTSTSTAIDDKGIDDKAIDDKAIRLLDLIEKTDEGPGRESKDIAYRQIRLGQGNPYFVYDKRGHGGANLYSLFSGRGYEVHVLNGVSGYLLRNRGMGTSLYTRQNGQVILKVGYMEKASVQVQRTTDILSGGVAIRSLRSQILDVPPVYHVLAE